MLIFLFKTIFFIFLNFLQYTFSNLINYSISTKLYKGYLNLDYIFHTGRHSSNLEHNILTETNSVTAVFTSVMTIITEGIIVLFLLIFLLAYDFTSSILVFSFLLILSLIIYKITRLNLVSWGSKRLIDMENRFKNLKEGLQSIKEIYIQQKSSFFVNNFTKYSKSFLNLNRNFHTIASLTRPIFEFVGLLTLITLLLFMLYQGHVLSSLLTIVGLYLAATFRILPSLNKIITGGQQIKFNFASVERILQEFTIINKNYKLHKDETNLKFDKKIIFSNVGFSYNNENLPVLKNLNFSIEKGSKFGIKGKSGSGKTTLINLILTLLKPSEGQIKIDSVSLKQNNISWLKNIGYVSQDTNLIDDTIEKNIAFGSIEEDVNPNKLKKAIDNSQLGDFIKSLKDGVKTQVGDKGQMLSGGQRQRIGIARALYNNPSVIILDEPTSALDLEAEKMILDTIYTLDRTKTVIIVSHRETVFNRCDKVLNISDGKATEIYPLANGQKKSYTN